MYLSPLLVHYTITGYFIKVRSYSIHINLATKPPLHLSIFYWPRVEELVHYKYFLCFYQCVSQHELISVVTSMWPLLYLWVTGTSKQIFRERWITCWVWTLLVSISECLSTRSNYNVLISVWPLQCLWVTYFTANIRIQSAHYILFFSSISVYVLKELITMS